MGVYESEAVHDSAVAKPWAEIRVIESNGKETADSFRIKLVDGMGNEVGGQGMLGGVSVQD